MARWVPLIDYRCQLERLRNHDIIVSGSPIHAARALEYPRWEDFKYEQLDSVHNRFYWLGNGTTLADTDPKADSESFNR